MLSKNIINKFNNIIINIAKHFKDIEEYTLYAFNDEYNSKDQSLEVMVKIYDKDEKEIYKTYILGDALSFIENNEELVYKITIDHFIEKYEEFVMTIWDLLLRKVDFNDYQIESIIEYICRDFFDSFEDAVDLDEDLKEIITYLSNEKLTTKHLYKRFIEDFDFSQLILANYCNEILYEYEVESIINSKDKEIIEVDCINSYVRKKIVNIINYLNMNNRMIDSWSFLANYLMYNISLKNINVELYKNIYCKGENEVFFKKYMIYIILYDAYDYLNSIRYNIHELSYLEFMDNHTLEDILTLFKNDVEFRMTAIKYFYNLYNYGYQGNNFNIGENIIRKFKPISIVESLNQSI